MKFIGIDLTSAFTATPRPIDIAVLDDFLEARFFAVAWPPAVIVISRDSTFLTQALLTQVSLGPSERIVLAVDGPQGLAATGNTMRACERTLGTPGRTPSELPLPQEVGVPFQGYIRSSIDLFAALVKATPSWRLAGLTGVTASDAGLWEVFPGAEYVVLAGRRLRSKTTEAGRRERQCLFHAAGVIFPTNALPTADQNDALVGAYLAWCVHHRRESVELVGVAPTVDGDIREGFILHANSALRINLSAGESPTSPTAPDSQVGQGDQTAQANDWNDDRDCFLMLTDYGLVHGTELENAWLVAGQNYVLETVPPDPPAHIWLEHAPTFAGGRGWRAQPTIRSLLGQLGHATPPHLCRQNAVTLRVVGIVNPIGSGPIG
ncbi:MAG: DUF429 domain-containing protein [Deltaproteobacteria bacterium]|nr:DUF429 domain-containing protein [Deltaproteobacteria bacterium]